MSKFRSASYNTFWDMNYFLLFLVKYFWSSHFFCPDGQTDGKRCIWGLKNWTKYSIKYTELQSINRNVSGSRVIIWSNFNDKLMTCIKYNSSFKYTVLQSTNRYTRIVNWSNLLHPVKWLWFLQILVTKPYRLTSHCWELFVHLATNWQKEKKELTWKLQCI